VRDWLAPIDPAAIDIFDRFGVRDGDGSWVVVRRQKLLVDPSNLQLAQAIGLDLVVNQAAPADFVMVGAGPAGLSAAVYGASGGLATVVDDLAIGRRGRRGQLSRAGGDVPVGHGQRRPARRPRLESSP
jgi:thioredoxin reductase (NADPH)